jgi:hypothetical protein
MYLLFSSLPISSYLFSSLREHSAAILQCYKRSTRHLNSIHVISPQFNSHSSISICFNHFTTLLLMQTRYSVCLKCPMQCYPVSPVTPALPCPAWCSHFAESLNQIDIKVGVRILSTSHQHMGNPRNLDRRFRVVLLALLPPEASHDIARADRDRGVCNTSSFLFPDCCFYHCPCPCPCCCAHQRSRPCYSLTTPTATAATHTDTRACACASASSTGAGRHSEGAGGGR